MSDQETPDIVWESKLDGKYDCRVIRKDHYNGTLKVLDGDNLLLEKDVGLSYGAVFGPDVADVNQWMQDAMQLVDSL